MSLFDDPEIKETIFLEIEDLLNKTEAELQLYEKDIKNNEHVKKLFRFIHTIKGNAGMLENAVMVNLAHKVEDMLGMIRNEKLANRKEFFPLYYETHDLLDKMYKKLKADKEIDFDITEIMDKLQAAMQSKGFKSVKTKSGKKDKKKKESQIKISKSQKKDKKGSKIRAEKSHKKEKDTKSGIAKSQKKERAIKIEPKKIDKKTDKAAGLIDEISKEFFDTETIRTDLSKIDNLVNLLGELHLTNRMHIKSFKEFVDLIRTAKMRADEIKNSDELAGKKSRRPLYEKSFDLLINELEDKILKFNYLFDEFREKLLNVRMVSVSTLFNRFPKMVRDLASKLNKKIEINFQGENTTIDKRVLEEASEPLLHIIRNSIDHGIELPATRKEKGKPETGSILVKTYPQGGNIIIDISDDGKGIDSIKIKNKLLEKKLFTKTELSTMTEKEIINTVFLPGFSTKDNISNVSGRGVGMDIVAEKVKSLKGEVDIIPSQDKGTIVKIILPMTLSIIEMFSVILKNEEYLFIKDDVKFLLKATPDQIQYVGNKSIINYEDKIIPVFRLGELFSDNLDKDLKVKPGNEEFINIVVFNHKDNLYGFEIDKFNGIKAIVLKNFGTHIKKLKLFEGATINEEGIVSLVISKSGIVEKALKIAV